MSGNATTNERLMNGLLLFIRLGMAGFLYVHCIGQLMAFWQAAQIIGLGAFPVLLTNAAIPLMFFIGAVMLALALSGSLGVGALNAPLRLTVILLLLQPVIFGGGRWSVDGLITARLAARAAQ